VEGRSRKEKEKRMQWHKISGKEREDRGLLRKGPQEREEKDRDVVEGVFAEGFVHEVLARLLRVLCASRFRNDIDRFCFKIGKKERKKREGKKEKRRKEKKKKEKEKKEKEKILRRASSTRSSLACCAFCVLRDFEMTSTASVLI
jgi:hypothetical protein